MNPLGELRVSTLDELPVSPPAGTIANVGSEGRFIFDGFKWWGEGEDGERVEYRPQPQSSDFKHCPDCVGTQVLTMHPPKVRYECATCGGGDEDMADLTKMEVMPNPLFYVGDSDSVCIEAHRLINGDRLEDYGDTCESFTRIAGLWSVYCGIDLSALDVANLMVLMKVSRSKGRYKRDNYVDIAGYAGCAERIHDATPVDAG